MNCSEVRNYILTGKKVEESREILKHIETCEKCHTFFLMISSAENVFKETKILPIETVFTESFHKTLKNEYEKNRHFSFLLSKKLAFMIPVFAVIIISFIFLFTDSIDTYNENNMELISRSVVMSGEPVTITIDYLVDREYDNTTVKILLPEGVAFYSASKNVISLKDITWRGKLKKGDNKIPFVVKLKDSGTYNIMTKAVYNNLVHTHKIILESDNKNIVVSMYKISNVSI